MKHSMTKFSGIVLSHKETLIDIYAMDRTIKLDKEKEIQDKIYLLE